MNSSKKFAIIGIGCRFPGGIKSLDELWSVLLNGQDMVTEVPSDRFDKQRYYHPDRKQPARTCTISAGVIPDIKEFDHSFWGMSLKEAEALDPQQRLMLEMTWEAFEDAGIRPSSVAGADVGVFVGAASTDMGLVHSDDLALTGPYSMTGTSLSIISNRISYIFDLKGPSMTIDTACSSSLVALNEACRSIESDSLSMAIVGGVNVLLSPVPFIGFSKAHMLSPHGRCRVFDQEGDGYVRAEGGAVILVKSLEEAIAHHDKIYAVIEGIGINSDGRTNGIALPNEHAQKALLKSVYSRAGIKVKDLSYIEAHGTGTAAGDPIEAKSIGSILGRSSGEDPLWVGSVKSNLGHLETGSGMAGLAKALLVIRHRTIPKNLHFENPNKEINFAELGIKVPTDEIPLPLDKPVMVGVNSFGFGGTNAHVVLKEYIGKKEQIEETDEFIKPLILSARSEVSLLTAVKQYAQLLKGVDNREYNRIVTAVLQQRELFGCRLLIKASTREEVINELINVAQNGLDAAGPLVTYSKVSSVPGKTALVFSGNGSQWRLMGADLYRNNALFRQTINEIDQYFYPLAHWRIAQYLQQSESLWDLNHTEYAQPLLFALQVAMFKLMRQEGVTFDAVVGHSVGEVAASFASGAFDLPQAVRIIYERSKAQAKTYGSGVMAAVKIEREKLDRLLELVPHVEIAGFNTADSFTVTGEEPEILSLGQMVKEIGGLFKKLDLAYSFHSSKMQSLKDEICQSLAQLKPKEDTSVIFFSTVTGDKVRFSELQCDYWWKNIRQPVCFEKAIVQMLEEGYHNFIEVGPHSILSGYVKQIGKQQGIGTEVYPLMKRGDHGDIFIKNCRRAYLATYSLSQAEEKVDHTVSLPHYSWNKKICWPEPTALSYRLFDSKGKHPLLGRAVTHAQWTWENELDLATHPWLSGHEIDETVLFPAACFLELATQAARFFVDSKRNFEIKNFQILKPLPLQEDSLVLIRTEISDQGILSISSKDPLNEHGWVVHVKARIAPSDAPCLSRLDLSVFSSDDEKIEASHLYERVAKLGLCYKGAFRALQKACDLGHSYIVKVESKDPVADEGMKLSPALVDGILQGLFFLLKEEDNTAHAYLPTTFGNVQIWRFGRPSYGVVRLVKCSEFSLVADFEIYDQAGEVLASLKEVRFRRVRHGKREITPCFYEEKWSALSQYRLDSYLSSKDWDELEKFVSSETELPSSNSVDIKWLKLVDLLKTSLVFEAVRDFNNWTTADYLFTQALSTEHENFCQYLAEILLSYGLAEREDNLYRVNSEQAIPSSDTIIRTMIANYPEYWTETVMLSEAAHHFSKLFTDSVSTEIELALTKSVLWQQIRQTPSEIRLQRVFVNILRKAITLLNKTTKCLRVALLINNFSELAWQLSRFSDQIDLTLGVSDPITLERIRQEFSEQRGLRIVDIGSQMQNIEELGRQDLILITEDLTQVENFEDFIKAVFSQLYNDGELLMIQSSPQGVSDFVCGTQPDWWRHSKEQVCVSSLIDSDGWMRVLKAAGFEHVHVFEQVWMNQRLLITARRQKNQIALPPSEPSIASLGILIDQGNQSQKYLADKLVAMAQVRGINVFVTHQYENSLQVTRWLSLLDLFVNNKQAPLSTFSLLKHLANTVDSADVACLCLESQKLKAKAVQGLVRVAGNEASHIRFSYVQLVDIDDVSLTQALDILLQERLSCQEYRIHKKNVETMKTYRLELPSSSLKVKRLIFDAPGKLDRLLWRDIELPVLGKDEVCIRVKATGLNFRDVMWTMGLLPEEALENGFSGPSLGLECSGVVESVGANVSEVKVGDEVIAFAPSCFSTHVVTNKTAVYVKPSHLSFEQAASIPVAFFTAWYAIKYLARAKKAEKILIHGAMGGVGLAALQIASLLGLEVFATAGSDVKRNLLKALGVQHIYDSRSLAFADHILADTQGKGVDLILNSLAGQGAEKSLAVLAPFGRFLELGKRDFFEDNPLFLRPFSQNLSYFGIDLDQLLVQQPELAKELFTEMLEHFKNKTLRPLPYSVYQAEDVVKAFQAMQASQHIGKIVITYEDSFHNSNQRETEQLALRSDRTYLITGGLGGLGLAVAQDLSKDGAKTIVLVSRRQQLTCLQEQAIKQMQREGTSVYVFHEDVSSEHFENKLDELLVNLPPLGGVIHAAGMLSDAMLKNQTVESFEKVWAPKVEGLTNLDHYTRSHGDNLDFFLVFSSATTLLGNPGQSNYVAANLAMEAIVEDRIRSGEPGTLIGWGPVGDVGMLRQNDQARQSLEKLLGARALTVSEVLKAIKQALNNHWGLAHYCAIDWEEIRHLPIGSSLRLKSMMKLRERSSTLTLSLLEELSKKTPQEAIDFLSQEVRLAIANIMGVAASELSEHQPIAEIGMDSLMMVELSIALEERLGIKVPAVSLSGGATIRTIAERFYKHTVSKEDDNQMVDILQAQHGVVLRDDLKEKVIRNVEIKDS